MPTNTVAGGQQDTAIQQSAVGANSKNTSEQEQHHLKQREQQQQQQEEQRKEQQQRQQDDLSVWFFNRPLEDDLAASRRLKKRQHDQPEKNWCSKYQRCDNGSTIVEEEEDSISEWQPLSTPVRGGSPRRIDVVHLEEKDETDFSENDMFF